MQNITKKKMSEKHSQTQKPNVDDYDIVVSWSDEDQCFLAGAPALKGSTTHGATPEEALTKGREAAALWLHVAYEEGHFIPPPPRHLSGRIPLRIPVSLHEKLAAEADFDHVSLNQKILTMLSESVGRVQAISRLQEALGNIDIVRALAPAAPRRESTKRRRATRKSGTRESRAASPT